MEKRERERKMGKGEGERGRVVESGFEEMETNITLLDGLKIFNS